MKIVFIASGMSIHSCKWVNYFSNKHDVVWVSTSGFDQDFLGSKKITYLDYQFTRNNFINSILGLFKIVLDVRQMDMIHLHYVGFHALTTFFLRSCPIVVTAWGSDVVFAEKSRIRTIFLLRYLKRAKLITCDSRHMRKKILSFTSNIPIKIINFGINTKKFKKISPDYSLKKELNLDSNNIIISTRNHEQVYDISTIIKSAQTVVNAYPDTIYIISGSGSMTSDLQKEVEYLSLAKNIIFVGGLSNADILRFLSISTVYVSSALSDGGIAASTAEAMSAEVPCIITDVVDNSDWVDDGVTGMLFEAKDAKGLSDKILTLLGDKNLREKIGENARKLIQENNDIGHEMEKMNDLYKSIC
jgi:glycosyltransferase involved in cell wall biosynthesis